MAVYKAEEVAEMLGDRLSAEGQLSSIGYVLEEGNYVLAGGCVLLMRRKPIDGWNESPGKV
jgi:hypothetical protein